MAADIHRWSIIKGLLAEGHFQDALKLLQQAVADGETDPVLLLNLAIAEDRTGAHDLAQRRMRLVADQRPTWDEPLLRLAESRRVSDDKAAAENTYRRVLEVNPNRQEALVALAGLLLMRGEPRQARDLLQRCCNINP
jgi:protein O-GlcNAc transferase